jgi:ABC-type uncharacterized transport system auxiliary subunit
MWKNNMTMAVHKRAVFTCMVYSVFLLGACADLTGSDKPPVTSWWLEPYTEHGSTSAAADQVIPVTVQVTVIPGLDDDRILTLSGAGELKPYSAARWVDNLPELLTSIIGRTVEGSGRFRVVDVQSRLESKPCEIQIESQAFFARLDSAGQTNAVDVAFAGYYQCENTAALQLDLNASTPIHDQHMKSIVAGFQQSTDSTMKGLLNRIQ